LKNAKSAKLKTCKQRRYGIRLLECDEGGYFVEIPDLPGCMSQGETVEEALKNIREARELWLEGAVESGCEIPEPCQERKYPGRLVVRLPASLHARLAEQAEREGVSLNQYAAVLLAEGNAQRAGARRRRVARRK
jgi:predicted RNase H-like HicB family nuclease